MPEIKDYSNTSVLQPTETGVETVARAARLGGVIADQAANAQREGVNAVGSGVKTLGEAAVEYEDHQQISKGAAQVAQFTQQKTQDWDNLVKGYTDADGTVHPPADWHDPTVASKFMSDMEPDFDKLRSGFWTKNAQAWAEHHIEDVRNHFNAKTIADMGTAAGEGVKVDYKQTANALSNTAMMSPDFKTVDDLIGQAKSGIAGIVGTSPNLRGVAGVAATSSLTEATVEQIVKAGMIGAIRKSPDPEGEAVKWAKQYPQYVNGQEANQATTEARNQLRFNRIEANAQAAIEKAEKREKADKIADQLELDTTRVDSNGKIVPTIPPNWKDRVNEARDAGVSPGRLSALITRGESIARSQDDNTARNVAAASRDTQADIAGKISSGEITDTAQIDKIYSDGKGRTLTWEAAQQLKKNLIDDKSASGQPLANRRNEVIKTMEPLIDPARTTAGNRSPAGSIALDRYQQALREAEQDAKKNSKNPQSIYDYDKDGNSVARNLARQFQVNLQQGIRSKLDAMSGKNLTGPNKTITGVSVGDQ
jgi:hypothetical protein